MTGKRRSNKEIIPEMIKDFLSRTTRGFFDILFNGGRNGTTPEIESNGGKSVLVFLISFGIIPIDQLFFILAILFKCYDDKPFLSDVPIIFRFS